MLGVSDLRRSRRFCSLTMSCNAWEIAWNPLWPIDEKGHVTFSL